MRTSTTNKKDKKKLKKYLTTRNVYGMLSTKVEEHIKPKQKTKSNSKVKVKAKIRSPHIDLTRRFQNGLLRLSYSQLPKKLFPFSFCLRSNRRRRFLRFRVRRDLSVWSLDRAIQRRRIRITIKQTTTQTAPFGGQEVQLWKR